jgi:site-specific recombinase XerD
VKSELQFTKSRAERTIESCYLSNNFISDIEKYRKHQIIIHEKTPVAVVASRNGGLIDPGNYNKLFKRILIKAKLDKANFDILRNTFILRCLEKGVSLKELSQILACDESSKSITKVYKIYKKSIRF